MLLYKFILNFFSKQIIFSLVLLNICIGSIFIISYQDSYNSDIEITSTDLLVKNYFLKEVNNPKNFSKWFSSYDTKLTFENISNIVTIDDTYEFLSKQKSIRLINKDKYTALQIFFRNNQNYIPHDFFNYLSFVKEIILKNDLTSFIDSDLALIYLLDFEINSQFDSEEKAKFIENYLILNLIIKPPTMPKLYGLSKIVLTPLILLLTNLVIILILIIFKIKSIIRFVKN